MHYYVYRHSKRELPINTTTLLEDCPLRPINICSILINYLTTKKMTFAQFLACYASLIYVHKYFKYSSI